MHRPSWTWIACLSAALGCSPEEPSGPPEWRAVFSDLRSGLLRVWGSSAQDVYVVGADAEGAGAAVLRFDGKRWRRLSPPVGGGIWWVQGVAPDDVRMVGDRGLVLRYTPSTDTFEVRETPTELRLFGVWGASSNDVWYVGGETGRGRGVILRDDGTTIQPIAHAATASAAFFKVVGFGADQVWMVGQRGRVLFWNGSELVERNSDTFVPLMGVHGVSSDRLWAVGGVGDGVMLAWNGSSWEQETPPATPQMIAVWAVSQEVVYAAGFNGRIFERSASGWTELAERIPTFQDLHAVWVDETGAIWAVGGRLAEDPPSGGVLIRYGPPISSEVIE